jgi:hypothetical protein
MNIKHKKSTHELSNTEVMRKLALGVGKAAFKHRYLIIIGMLLLLLILIFFDFMHALLVLILFGAVNVFLSIIARPIPIYNTSFEMIMLGTVLASVKYGGKIGALFGIILAVVFFYVAGRMSLFVTVYAPLYGIVGIFCGLFRNADILTLGMTCTVAYYIVSSLLLIILFNAKLHRAIVFGLINIPFNFIMFKYIAPIILMLM